MCFGQQHGVIVVELAGLKAWKVGGGCLILDAVITVSQGDKVLVAEAVISLGQRLASLVGIRITINAVTELRWAAAISHIQIGEATTCQNAAGDVKVAIHIWVDSNRNSRADLLPA